MSGLRAEIGAREQAQAALLQAQKMEAMGQLTGGVAHDFNNLLTAVSGSLALLEPRIFDEGSLRLLCSAHRGASRGAKLTELLLAFARKQHLDPIVADLNAIVVDMSEMLRQFETDALWTREYEDFVRAVSFAGPGEAIDFGDALAACIRLVAVAREGA